MASYLREHCRYFWMQGEILVLDEEATNSTKINAAEEVMQINVEDIAASLVHSCIRHDRVVSLETVCNSEMLIVN